MLMLYIDENFVEPSHKWSNRLFEELSYARWAAYEIVQSLMDRPLDPPDEVIEDFLLKIALYSHVSKNERHKRIFSVAEEVTEEILSLFS